MPRPISWAMYSYSLTWIFWFTKESLMRKHRRITKGEAREKAPVAQSPEDKLSDLVLWRLADLLGTCCDKR
jgi:hypothetical protein